MTIVEKNPGASPHIPAVAAATEGQRPRKAMRMVEGEVLTIERVTAMKMSMEDDAEHEREATAAEFFLRGKFSDFTEDFFDKDPPIVGEADNEKLCWGATLCDETGALQVKLWDRPCNSIFQKSLSLFRNVWEQGVDDPSKRDEILVGLNERLQVSYTLYCSMKIWSTAGRPRKHQAQVHVNAVPALV